MCNFQYATYVAVITGTIAIINGKAYLLLAFRNQSSAYVVHMGGYFQHDNGKIDKIQFVYG